RPPLVEDQTLRIDTEERLDARHVAARDRIQGSQVDRLAREHVAGALGGHVVAAAWNPGHVAALGEGYEAGTLIDRGVPVGVRTDADAEGIPTVLQRSVDDGPGIVQRLGLIALT